MPEYFDFGNNIAFDTEVIDSHAFKDCTNLESITLGEGSPIWAYQNKLRYLSDPLWDAADHIHGSIDLSDPIANVQYLTVDYMGYYLNDI